MTDLPLSACTVLFKFDSIENEIKNKHSEFGKNMMYNDSVIYLVVTSKGTWFSSIKAQ
jgi:hypothetical protein